MVRGETWAVSNDEKEVVDGQEYMLALAVESTMQQGIVEVGSEKGLMSNEWPIMHSEYGKVSCVWWVVSSG